MLDEREEHWLGEDGLVEELVRADCGTKVHHQLQVGVGEGLVEGSVIVLSCQQIVHLALRQTGSNRRFSLDPLNSDLTAQWQVCDDTFLCSLLLSESTAN